MFNLLKSFFNTSKAKKGNPIAARIEIKETSANTWWR
jgi:hypothetical protein